MARTRQADSQELKSERISVVVTPLAKSRLDKISFMQRKSLNALISEIIDNYVKKHTDDIKRYDETFKTENS